ncbi:MAG: hypothetical protein JST75_13660 [Bacteroidetes bacterium]|nr:hypothetical protein [Bacteroidota bacterium]
MKFRTTIRSMAFCMLITTSVRAQQLATTRSVIISQPDIFKKFPQKAACDIASLEQLFNMHDDVSLQLSPDFSLEGKIISRKKSNAFAETINIRLSEFQETIFTISRIQTENGETRFIGHILSLEGEEAIVLQFEDKQYFFIKTEQRFLMTD